MAVCQYNGLHFALLLVRGKDESPGSNPGLGFWTKGFNALTPSFSAELSTAHSAEKCILDRNHMSFRHPLPHMPNGNKIDDLPPQEVTVNGRMWTREKVDTDHFQWVRPMDETEYDWDAEEDDVSLVGVDVPIRAVSLQNQSGMWHVEAAETAGPSYHRPGFTELISSDFSKSYDRAEDASEAVTRFINRLS